MNPYAEKVPFHVWWTLGLSVLVVALLVLLPPAIEVVDRLKGFCAVLAGRAP